MSRRDPRRARVLGVWTASWLAAFLLAGVLRLGDLAVQWPVLAVPLLWALIALRPRRRPAWEEVRDDDPDESWDGDAWDEDSWDGDAWDGDAWDEDAERWPPEDRYPEDRYPGVLPRPEDRTDTVERPAVRRPFRDDRWDGPHRG
ncbi:hypothetical protein [Candidatus Blastococcus massiliensis]|uniref:hypothetical protein n=1 Tax=Candidatus Blastococcus massiliensis TaxID=1470358 RepID=UPI0004B6AA55|nr:hypothetical protein [Candidatus Blastococcus massiliensis]